DLDLSIRNSWSVLISSKNSGYDAHKRHYQNTRGQFHPHDYLPANALLWSRRFDGHGSTSRFATPLRGVDARFALNAVLCLPMASKAAQGEKGTSARPISS